MKLSKRELALALEYSRGLTDYIERLAGVRGPEQSLVGESRSDGEPDGAEERRERSERSEERSGVGEIGGAAELQRHIERRIEEERDAWHALQDRRNRWEKAFSEGVTSALLELLEHVKRMTEKRSDLSNARALAQPTKTSTEASDV